MDALTLLAQVGGTAGLTLLVVQYAVKPLIKDGRLWPIASIGVGVGVTIVAALATGQAGIVALAVAGLQGILSGLVASGAFSGTNAVRGK